MIHIAILFIQKIIDFVDCTLFTIEWAKQKHKKKRKKKPNVLHTHKLQP